MKKLLIIQTLQHRLTPHLRFFNRQISKLKKYLTQIKPFLHRHYRRFRHNPHRYFLTHRRQLLIAIPAILIALTLILNLITAAFQNKTPQAPKFTSPLVSDYHFQAKNQIYAAYLGHKDSNLPTVSFTVNDQNITFSLKNAAPSKPKKKNKTVVFENVADHLNISYQTLPNGIKEELILTQPTNTDTFYFTLDYAGLNSPKVINHVKAPVFYDDNGNYLFHFEKPFAYDSTGNRTDDVFLIIELDKSTNRYVSKLSVSPYWLSSPDRVYPIYIDPTIIHDESSEFTGDFNRTKDTGSGSTPSIETFYQELSTDPNTIGLWHMNDTSGSTVTDSSGRGNHGTATGTTITTGLFNNARSYNGTSDRVEVGTTLSSANITIEAWVYRTSSTTTMGIVRKNSAYALSLSGDTIQFAGNPWSFSNTGVGIELNQWIHLAITQNGNTAIVYKNGRQIASFAQSGNLASNTNQTRIGYDDNNWWWGGLIDEVRISNIARTPEEIWSAAQRRPLGTYTSPVIDLTYISSFNSLFWSAAGIPTGDGETASNSANLIAQWNFNETSGTTASVTTGSCGSSCNNTLTNFADSSNQDVTAGSGWTALHRRWGAGALMFDGSNDYISCTDTNCGGTSKLDIGTNSISIESWIKTTSTDSQNTIVSKGTTSDYSYALYSNASGKANFILYQAGGAGYTSVISKKTVNDGQWHHLTGVWNPTGTALSLYVDGVLDSSTTSVTGTLNNNTAGSFSIGSSWTNSGYFKGVIDVVRFYSRVLPAHEILSNYNSTQTQFQTRTSTDSATWEAWKPNTSETLINAFSQTTMYSTSEANLISYWPLDETTNGTCSGSADACDATSSNHGTATGTTIVDGTFNKARSFNGTSDYVTIGTTSSLEFTTNDPITIEAWIYRTSSPTYSTIIGRRDTGNNTNYRLGFDANKTSFWYYDTSNSWHTWRSTDDIPINTYQHIAVTYTFGTGSSFKMYINGSEVSGSWITGNGNTAPQTGPLTTAIGRAGAYSAAATYFPGIIDEVRVYKATLSAGTIYNHSFDNSTNPASLSISSDPVIKQQNDTSLNLKTNRSIVESNTVLYYPLDETNGDLVGNDIFDISGNNNHGEIEGSNLATGVVNGVSGKARDFNGSDDYIDTNTPGNSFTTGTMETWFYSHNAGSIGSDSVAERFFTQRRSAASTRYALGINNNQVAVFWYDGANNTQAGGVTLLPDTWYHAATTYDGNNVRLYLNGIQVGTWVESAMTAPSVDSTFIGKGAGNDRYFNGFLDEPRISKVARTADEIAETYRLGRDYYLNKTITNTNLSSATHLLFSIAADEPGAYLQTIIGESPYVNYQPDTNTIGLWHLEEQSGSGAYIKDSSGRNNHGTPTDTTFVQGVLGKARNFTGTNNINIGNKSIVDSASDLTVDAWVYPTAQTSATHYRVFSEENVLYVGQYGSNVSFYMGNGSSWTTTDTTGGTLLLNTWSHVAWVKNGTTASIYINGQLSKTGISAPSTLGTSSNVNYISTSNGSSQPWTGSLDQIRISNTARTADEIRQTYEIGRRTYPITIDFAASLDSGNLIANGNDLSFTVDATTKGLNSKGSNLYTNDIIIIKENSAGTEYLAQGQIATVNTTTGAVTITGWDTGSTFPSGGFTAKASVFKWQTEYFDLSGIKTWDRNTITNLTFRITDGNQGRSIWLDGLKSSSGYLTNNLGSTITSTPNRYFQYRALTTSADPQVSPQLHSVTLNYSDNISPSAPTIEAAHLHDNLYTPDTTPSIRFSSTDPDSDELVYHVQWYTDADFSSPNNATSSSDSGFENITTPSNNSPFNPGNIIAFTFPTLSNSTTYFYRIRAIDPNGSNGYSNWSTIRSFTVNTSLSANAWHQTHADQFSTNTIDQYVNIDNINNYVTIDEPLTYRSVTINNSGSQQNDYDVLIELDTASLISANKMQSDCDDLRFWTDETLTASFDYYLESGCNTSTTHIWVRLPTLSPGDNTIYMSYNDSGASSGSLSFSSNFILPRTSDCPGGSTRLSALDGLYPRGNSSYGGSGNGSHDHSISGNTSNSTGTGNTNGGNTRIRYDHAHTFSTTSGNNTNSPPNVNTIFCNYGSTIPNPIGTNDLALFTSLLSGWTRNTTYDNRFMIGASSYGSTGGNAHTHTVSGTTGNTGTPTASNQYSVNENAVPSGSHNHSYSNNTNSSDPLPPYYTMIFASKDSNGPPPSSLIAMINSSNLPPLGWTRFTSLDEKFPYGSSSSGSTGGTTTHTHTYSFASGAPSSTEPTTWTPGGGTITGHNHTHTISGTSGSGSNLPPYLDLIFIQKKSDSTTKTFGNEISYSVMTSTKITGSNIHDAAWKELKFTDDQTYGSITYQILYNDNGTPTLIPDNVLTDNSTGFTTSPVNLSSISKTTYPELYVRATFTYSNGSPILYDWTVSTNDPPHIPTLDSPAHHAIRIETLPTLQTTATDPEIDYLRYKIQLCTDSAMTQNCQTFDQTSSQTGWSGQNTQSNTAYTSGTQASYTLQTALPHNQVYYWRSYAIDPGGTNIWSQPQPFPFRFTTIHVVPPSECTAEVASDFSSITIRWVDNTLDEDSFELEKKINSGTFTNIQTTLPDITSYQDSTVSATNAYQYRVRTIINSDPSVWCNTAVLDLGTGSFQFEGLQLEGLQVH